MAGSLLPQPLAVVRDDLPRRLQLRSAHRRTRSEQGQHVRALPRGLFGNRELLYRDPDISSLWPIPVRPRPQPPVIPSVLEPDGEPMGTFVVQDVYRAYPPLARRARRTGWNGCGSCRCCPRPRPTPTTRAWAGPTRRPANRSSARSGRIRRLGPLPRAGQHPAALPGARPAGALDPEHAQRDLPPARRDEVTASDATSHGVHAPPDRARHHGAAAAPSEIAPGPDGSNPLSYPLLVQPVLDKHCVECHGGPKPGAASRSPSKPEKEFTESYNQLCQLCVLFRLGRPRTTVSRLSQPDHFGARGSTLDEVPAAGTLRGPALATRNWTA